MNPIERLVLSRARAGATLALAAVLTAAATSGSRAISAPASYASAGATASAPCANVPSPEPSAPGLAKAAWLITVRTSGGFTGAGDGNFSIRSDGAIWADGCTALADSSTLAKLGELVGATHEDLWQPSYVGPANGCCDQVEVSLSLSRTLDGKTTSHATRTVSAEFMTAPADFRALYAFAQRAARPYGSSFRRFHTSTGSTIAPP